MTAKTMTRHERDVALAELFLVAYDALQEGHPKAAEMWTKYSPADLFQDMYDVGVTRLLLIGETSGPLDQAWRSILRVSPSFGWKEEGSEAFLRWLEFGSSLRSMTCAPHYSVSQEAFENDLARTRCDGGGLLLQDVVLFKKSVLKAGAKALAYLRKRLRGPIVVIGTWPLNEKPLRKNELLWLLKTWAFTPVLVMPGRRLGDEPSTYVTTLWSEL